MSTINQATNTNASDKAEFSDADALDFWQLMKPRVMSLVVFTALVGMVIAPGTIHPFVGAVALLCIALGGGASGALNMWYDADIDAIMTRTKNRPIPAGRISAGEALGFGSILAFGSVSMLGVLVSWPAAALLAFTIFFYVVIYTMWLKRTTPQNIVIGGAAGAFPPMIGWAAVTGTVTIESIVLFLIVFMWTPPHFWALALVKSEDYRKAGVPMLPVSAGHDETRKQILLYSLIFVPICLLPLLLGFAGYAYAAIAGAGGIAFLWLALNVYRIREGEAADRASWRLFGYSIFYLFAIFATLLVEHLVALPLFTGVDMTALINGAGL
ncbi:MAG: protoheme IX farnesyltransferase [Cohaesibacteraceae bacterium]|nr:protoheme IX farnesyltransferase [Cohaesibacteraceae bacterium]